MENNFKMPQIKTIVGSLIFSSNRPLSVKDIKKCFKEVAETDEAAGKAFADIQNSDIEAAIEEIRRDIEKSNFGFILAEVAGGFRFQSEPSSGLWVRHFLAAGRPARLSIPALETLAIIAYRQPISKADIEAIRGVNVDHIIKGLLANQLIRITGRSDMPGRPFLYGTTQTFLEHFGLKSLKDLGDMEPFLATMKEQAGKLMEKEKTSDTSVAGFNTEGSGTIGNNKKAEAGSAESTDVSSNELKQTDPVKGD